MTTYTKESLYSIITLLQYTIDGLKYTHILKTISK